MLRAVFSFRGLVLIFGLVALGLPSALVLQLGNVRTLNTINQKIASVRDAQAATADVLQLQIDEESAVRTYAETKVALFLEPYHRASLVIDGRLLDLALALHDAEVGEEAQKAQIDLAKVHEGWMRQFAEPVVAGLTAGSVERAIKGKLLIDRFRGDLVPIRNALDKRQRELGAARDRAVATTTYAALTATGVIALELVVFAIVIARIQRELDREHAVVETLQRAASGRLVAPPHLAIGTAYRSATRGTSVGGDVYDVYRLDEQRTLLVIGDVSGKGVTAAVDTTFVRYALRALAAEHHGAAEIMRRFDALYRAADRPPESFVTLFVGVHQRDGTITYANAGHGACWVRRGETIEELAPTGPVVGIGGLPFEESTAKLRPGDLLILATDGLTEARAPGGGFVPEKDVRAWLLEADATNPQRYVDSLIAAVTRYVRGRISDDLAVLTVTPA